MERITLLITILTFTVLAVGCAHAPDIYEITTTVDGEPVESTLVAISSEDTGDTRTFETNEEGFVSFKFPHSSQWRIEFRDEDGEAYPATAVATPEVNGKIHIMTVDVAEEEQVRLP